MSARSPRQLQALPFLLLAGTTAALLSSCELPDRKNHSHVFNQTEDLRYAKDLSQPGPWICTLSVTYSTSEKGVQSQTLVAEAEDGATVSKKIRESCADLDAATRQICETTFDADQYSCANAAKFIPPYSEVAETVGHWTCDMPYTYAAPMPSPGPSPLPSPGPSPLASPGPSPLPSPTPSQKPASAPAPSMQQDRLQSAGETSLKAASLALDNCLAKKPEAAREACAAALTAVPSTMQCWNIDLGKDARPRVKIRRTRH